MTTPNSFLDRFSRHFTKTDRIAAACAALYWLVYCILGLDLQFFEFKHTKYRLVFLCLLIFLAIVLVRLFRRVFVEKDTFSRRFLLYTGINLAILSVFLLLLWPGTWSWDDIEVLNAARTYAFVPWQHFITSLFMIFSIYLLPTSGGAGACIFIQTVIVSFISGYLIALLRKHLPDGLFRTKLALFVSFIPFLLPPVIFHALFRYRSVMCIYLEVLLLGILIDSYFSSIRSFSKSKLCFLLCLTILVSCWRSENFYYVFILGIYLIVFQKRKPKSTFLFYILFPCLAVFLIGHYNQALIGSNNYTVMSIADPITELVRAASSDSSTDNSDILEDIDPVLSTDLMLSSNAAGDSLYWQAIQSYDDSEYRSFCKAYIKLILSYPQTFLKERLHMLWDTLGFNDNAFTHVDRSSTMFDDPSASYTSLYFQQSKNDIPWNASLRKTVTLLLGGYDSNLNRTIFYHIFWNLLPPFLVLCGSLLLFLKKKNPLLILCDLFCLAKIPIIFLTAPGCHFLYYYSIYFIGYICLFFGIAYFIGLSKSRNKGIVRL